MEILEANKRESVKKSVNRKIRSAGRIPAVVYGKDTQSVPISVDENDFFVLMRNEGSNAVFNLNLDTDSTTVMVKEIQYHPTKNLVMHVDFNEINMKEETIVEVPLETIGESAGEKEGGFLQLSYQTIEVKCLPGDIPESLQVDVSELEIGDSLTVDQLEVSDKVELLADADTVLVSILPPAQEEEEQPAADADAEPELVGADKEEAESEES